MSNEKHSITLYLNGRRHTIKGKRTLRLVPGRQGLRRETALDVIKGLWLRFYAVVAEWATR